MTAEEMVNRVNMLLDKINSFQADTLLISEVVTALNIAQETFVKQRFGRANKYGKGFEENQKRLDDIASLVLDAVVTPDYSENIGNGFHRDVLCQLPGPEPTEVDQFSDLNLNASVNSYAMGEYMFLVSVRAHIRYRGCKMPLIEDSDWTYTIDEGNSNVSVNHEININHQGRRTMVSGAPGIQVKHGVLCKYAQNDDIFELLKDPFNTTALDGPLYTMSGFIGSQPAGTSMNRSQIEIYTDNTFIVDNIAIRYIKQPDRIRYNPGVDEWGCQLANHTHMEIVNMAVDLLLESMSDPRYKSHQMETLKSD